MVKWGKWLLSERRAQAGAGREHAEGFGVPAQFHFLMVVVVKEGSLCENFGL